VIFKTDFAPGLGEPVGSRRDDHKDEARMHLAHKAERAVELDQIEVAEEGLFPEVESLATRMKGLARCGEELF
jgi:hypothetical protein